VDALVRPGLIQFTLGPNKWVPIPSHMDGGVGHVALEGSAVVVAGAVASYVWVRQLRTSAQVRARSQETAGSFDEDLERWLSTRLSARWLVESAHAAAKATMRPEAIDFYNKLAEKWNDDVGWAERRLITIPVVEEVTARYVIGR
jgi:hypothetical protein